jgi:uncharacterized protein
MTVQLEISIKRQPSRDRLNELQVTSWPIWQKEVSEFPWTYDMQETCYFLEGDVIVTPDGGQPVQMGKGDLVTFPAGMSCTWKILQAVRKHYCFE